MVERVAERATGRRMAIVQHIRRLRLNLVAASYSRNPHHRLVLIDGGADMTRLKAGATPVGWIFNPVTASTKLLITVRHYNVCSKIATRGITYKDS